jgi:hypothetical protein
MSQRRSFLGDASCWSACFLTEKKGMAFAGLACSRCLHRSISLRRVATALTLQPCYVLESRPISHYRQFPPLLHASPRRFLHTILPLSSTFRKLTIHRQFSTPSQNRERHENIYTIPNILTFSRLLSTPIIAYLILNDKPYLATSLLLYAGLTDLIDGWIARKYNLKSVVGTVIDPMADKFLMVTLTGTLAYTGAMPSPFYYRPG